MWTCSSEVSSHEKTVSCARWSKDGSHIATSSTDRKLRLFSVSNSDIRLKHDYETVGNEKLSWNPRDCFSFATVSLKNQLIRFYDFRVRDEVWSIESGTESNFSLCWSTQGDYVVATTKKDNIFVVDCRNRSICKSGACEDAEIHSSLCIPSSFFRIRLEPQADASFSSDDSIVMGVGLPATNNDKISRAIDEGGFQLKPLSNPGSNVYQTSCHCGFVTTLAHASDLMAVGSVDTTISLWNGDLDNVGVISRHETPVRDVSVSSNGKHIASSAQDNQVIISTVSSTSGGRPTSDVVEFGSSQVRCVDFYPVEESARAATVVVGLEDRASGDRRSLLRLVTKNSNL